MRFKRDEAFFLGAFTLNLCVTLVSMFAVLIWLVIRQSMEPNAAIVVPVTVGVLCATVLPILFYPISYSLWAALDLSSDPLELQEISDALDATMESEQAREVAQGDKDGCR